MGIDKSYFKIIWRVIIFLFKCAFLKDLLYFITILLKDLLYDFIIS